jgi:hypothetical protein
MFPSGRSRSFALFPLGVNAVGTKCFVCCVGGGGGGGDVFSLTITVSVTGHPSPALILTRYSLSASVVTIGEAEVGLSKPVAGIHSYDVPIALAVNGAGTFGVTITSV